MVRLACTLRCHADFMNSRFCSHTILSCGIHKCPRKCHNLKDHRDLGCPVKVPIELLCGHSVNRRCHQSKAPPDACFSCKLAEREVDLGEEDEERDRAGTNDRSSAPVQPRSPTSPPPSWRDRRAATATDNGIWRNGRSTDRSTNVFTMYRGPGQSTNGYKGGLFNKPKAQSDPFYLPSGGSDRDGWRK